MDNKLIYEALLCHDGHSLMPEWPPEKQRKLSLSLDELRLKLLDEAEQQAHSKGLKKHGRVGLGR